MLAWGDESGDDWDMKIAEDLFSRWFDAAFQKAPDSGTGVINLLVLAVALFFITMDQSVFFSLYKEVIQADLTGIRLLYVVAVVVSAVIILAEESDL
jgi:hypothetical protein